MSEEGVSWCLVGSLQVYTTIYTVYSLHYSRGRVWSLERRGELWKPWALQNQACSSILTPNTFCKWIRSVASWWGPLRFCKVGDRGLRFCLLEKEGWRVLRLSCLCCNLASVEHLSHKWWCALCVIETQCMVSFVIHCGPVPPPILLLYQLQSPLYIVWHPDHCAGPRPSDWIWIVEMETMSYVAADFTFYQTI